MHFVLYFYFLYKIFISLRKFLTYHIGFNKHNKHGMQDDSVFRHIEIIISYNVYNSDAIKLNVKFMTDENKKNSSCAPISDGASYYHFFAFSHINTGIQTKNVDTNVWCGIFFQRGLIWFFCMKYFELF